MNIAIIGAGNVGATLGDRLAKLGHGINYGVNNPQDDKHQQLKTYASVTTNTEAVAASEIVFIATPWRVTLDLVSALEDALSGKILVDCTNPLNPDLNGLAHSDGKSGAEQIAAKAPKTTVVKGFNTTGFNIMATPQLQQQQSVMFVCSDDDKAANTINELAQQLDFNSVILGDLSKSALLESFALTWITLAYKQGLGRDFGFALIKQ